MATVYKRKWKRTSPSGKKMKCTAWGYTLMINGRRERKFSEDWLTKAQALGALVTRQSEVEAGREERAPERTLAQLVGEYLAYKRSQHKRTVDDDGRILKNRVLRVLDGRCPVRQLTASRIAHYEKRRLEQVSAYTVANELSILRHMLRVAKRLGYIDAVPEIEMPKKPEGRLRYLERGEINKLLGACAQSRNPYLHGIVVLAVHTGMRKGEILGLEWERIDLSSARITLYRTKNGKPRGVPMNRAVYDALVALELDQAKREGRVFRRGDGAAWGQIRTAFERAVSRAGIKDFRFHDLRHTAASHLVMRGATLPEVKEILGHSDIKMTMRYAHLSPAHLRGAVERLEGLTDSTPASATPAPSEAAEVEVGP